MTVMTGLASESGGDEADEEFIINPNEEEMETEETDDVRNFLKNSFII